MRPQAQGVVLLVLVLDPHLDEVAREIPYFAAATDPIPEHGLDLKVNQLATA